MALPLLIPWNVIGTIWVIFLRPDIGLLGHFIDHTLGIHFDYPTVPIEAWISVMMMEVWHWTPLVVLLAYAGLRSIPDAYYQAAQHRRRLGAGRCSATSSCPRCAAC